MKQKYYLNHMAAPSLSARDLVLLAQELDIQGIELRNDIGNGDPFTGELPEEIGRIAKEAGITLATINALQQCNRRDNLAELLIILKDVAQMAGRAGISAIVFCPVNDMTDTRKPSEALQDLEKNLIAFAPVLAEHNLTGLIEPLGFNQSSLRSQSDVLDLLGRNSFTCYRLMLDTFHLALGPDSIDMIKDYPISMIGMLHLSGVEEELPVSELTDNHRVLPGPGDRIETIRQARTLIDNGYTGPISFEPFAPEYGKMNFNEAAAAIRKSLGYVKEQLK